MEDFKEHNNHVFKMALWVMLLAELPLLAIFLMNYSEPGRNVLTQIYLVTESIPSITSSVNRLMSKAMDIYDKTAPLLAVIVFIFLKKMKPNKRVAKDVYLKICILFPLIFIFYIWFILFRDMELTQAGRPVRLLATNDVTLLIYYAGLYFVSYLLTYLTCYVPTGIYNFWKER